jgi:hypothetical protein
MRLVLLAALASLAACPVGFAGELPFTGYIAVSQTEVASGPGRRFYTTGKLPRGAEVEVYREDDAGWLAIRPPAGSFSWVPAEHVEMLDDGMGKVATATESWIGTTVEDVKEHKSQVALKVGELVEILDRKAVKTADGEEAWYKIAPPAGEFRYIHSRDVSREPPADDDEDVAAEPGAPLTPDVPTNPDDQPQAPRPFEPSPGAIALRDIHEVRGKLAAMRKELAGLAPDSGDPHQDRVIQQVQYQSTTSTSRSLSPDGFVPRKRRSSEQLGPVPVPSPHQVRSATPAFSRPMRDPPPQVAHARPLASAGSSSIGALSSGNFTSIPARVEGMSGESGELTQLELDLSLMVAQDKSTWNLAAIRSRVEQLVERGASPVERGQARLLLDKIDQFEDAFAVAGQGPLDPPATADQPPPGSPYAPRYDAKGWLKPVVSRTKPAAPYAVVDQDGKPLCFVTPSPGLNIARYANKEVGLFGKRGYIEELKTPHLVAERVIDLERHVR